MKKPNTTLNAPDNPQVPTDLQKFGKISNVICISALALLIPVFLCTLLMLVAFREAKKEGLTPVTSKEIENGLSKTTTTLSVGIPEKNYIKIISSYSCAETNANSVSIICPESSKIVWNRLSSEERLLLWRATFFICNAATKWFSIETLMTIILVWLLRSLFLHTTRDGFFTMRTVRLFKLLCSWSLAGALVCILQLLWIFPGMGPPALLSALYLPSLISHLLLGGVFFAMSQMMDIAIKMKEEQEFTI